MLSIKNSSKSFLGIMRLFFVLVVTLAMTSCSLDNTNAKETEDSIEEYTTAVPTEFNYGKYYPNIANYDTAVFLEITEDTIALIGDSEDIKMFFEYQCKKYNEPIDEVRINALVSEWEKPREYVTHTSYCTFIAWEWANDESHTMISGGHFEDETHFEFYSEIFEYKE